MQASLASATPTHCASCSTRLAPGARACPSCHALMHASQLDALSAEAQEVRVDR